MPVSVQIAKSSIREIRGFAHDLRRYGDIEGVAMGRASRDALGKVKTQMIKDVSKEINMPVTPIRERFGKRIFLDKVRSKRGQFIATLGAASQWLIAAGRGKNVRYFRKKGVLLTGHQFPNAFLLPSKDRRKKAGYVARRAGAERFPIEEVGIDFIDEADSAWSKNRGLATDVVDNRYDYWRERLYKQFNAKQQSAKSGFIRSLLNSL